MERTAEASEEELEQLLLSRLDRMLAQGSTTVEAKSGYGLSGERELRLLRVLGSERVRAHPVELSATHLGAHSVPKGSTADEATADLLEKQIPVCI